MCNMTHSDIGLITRFIGVFVMGCDYILHFTIRHAVFPQSGLHYRCLVAATNGEYSTSS
jgi:hypothetical protein